ncbi:MAG: RnfABCDGE type electron transport complex subunit G [Clostridia bacterium]|nr:RnfABCDGE type electron transport complex subunit G [Clostridia bacterium]
MRQNENPIILSTVLLVISVIVAFLLSFTNSITIDKIEENKIQEQNLAKQEVLPEAKNFLEAEVKDETGLVRALFEGFDENEQTVGYCVRVTPYGYGGELDIIVGIKADDTVSGIKVTSHSETPGLGAKVMDEEFPSQFNGKETSEPLSVIKNGTPKKNEIVAISGATITSKAVKDGVNAAMSAVKAIKGGA